MENLKIRVNSEAESKEALNLLRVDLKYGDKCFICNDTTVLTHCFDDNKDYKEITLPELRDMVVLKRNDVGDAIHVGKDLGIPYFVTSSGDVKVWDQKGWVVACATLVDLKPIEKKEMKEYLVELNEVYILVENDRKLESHWIEIPEGSETFNYYDRKDNLFFLKGSGEDTMFSNDLNDWEWKEWGDIDFDGVVCLWQRHTHPEELPFIDDEPLQSLNDQYAEIETVRQTLNQRQEQYGSFEDVAMITEQMVDVMRKGYYENLAYNQKMALYMICSKMARIVNGNPNHKDSWHDIAGYATLIDNELVSEKDMPF